MAKIDTSKIAGYSEMSADEKLNALEAFELPEADYSGYVKKEVADKYASEASSYKKKYKEALDDDARKKQEFDENYENMQKELAELKAEKQTNEHITQLLELGYSRESASKIAKATIEGDFKTVYAEQSKFIADTKKSVESDALKKTPAPNVGAEGEKELTREDFKKMSLAEKQRLKNEDPELFEKLSRKK